jgi:hypothetical protein
VHEIASLPTPNATPGNSDLRLSYFLGKELGTRFSKLNFEKKTFNSTEHPMPGVSRGGGQVKAQLIYEKTCNTWQNSTGKEKKYLWMDGLTDGYLDR